MKPASYMSHGVQDIFVFVLLYRHTLVAYMDHSSDAAGKVRTATGSLSYWTKRRKIRAAVDAFLSNDNAEMLEHQQAEGVTAGDNHMYCQQHVELADNVVADDNVSCEPEPTSDVPQNSDSETDSVEERNTDECLANDLIDWVSRFNIPATAVTALLHVLQPLHPNLPADARTLLHTPRAVSVRVLSDGGECVHLGVANGLKELFSTGHIKSIDKLQLQCSIDGIALYKSSNTSLWPILCLVKNSACKEPFVVGMYCGTSKPASVDAFLSDFVQEMGALLTSGVELSETHFDIDLHSFICDTPARAMVKNVKGPTGYFGCDKCETEGEWNGKITFVERDAPKRTDVRFDEMANEDHHSGLSALHPLGIGLVSNFPIDYMHLVCLGVMRRLLLCWLKGPLSSRLCARKVIQLSEKLLNIRTYVPREFGRKPRSVAEILRWKAVEFRQFLLYAGPVVLLHVLPEVLYQNFMLPSVGISLLANPRFSIEHCTYVRDILKTFVNNVRVLYGTGMMVYNVHALVHLADDVQRFGCLDNISAFPFENALMALKKTSARTKSHTAANILSLIRAKQLPISYSASCCRLYS